MRSLSLELARFLISLLAAAPQRQPASPAKLFEQPTRVFSSLLRNICPTPELFLPPIEDELI
jgi:hypothetical protein